MARLNPVHFLYSGRTISLEDANSDAKVETNKRKRSSYIEKTPWSIIVLSIQIKELKKNATADQQHPDARQVDSAIPA